MNTQVEYLVYVLKILSHIDLIVICFEGYSISDGEPSEQNCYEAIDAAYKYATKTAGLDPSQIVLFGRSLGTGPTVDLCSRCPKIAGCVLQSPLESGLRCVIGVCSSYTLYPLDIFRNYSKIENIQCPVFIMHGTDDRVVPCDNGRSLYAQLQERPFHESVDYQPLWIPDKGHNDMPQDICMQESRKFLKFLERRNQASYREIHI
jgi:pimeloyl-ACP methyl ester carboxylesterase